MAKKRIDEIIKSANNFGESIKDNKEAYEDHTTYEFSVPKDLRGAIIGRYDS